LSSWRARRKEKAPVLKCRQAGNGGRTGGAYLKDAHRMEGTLGAADRISFREEMREAALVTASCERGLSGELVKILEREFSR
jgi:hypothetical protein